MNLNFNYRQLKQLFHNQDFIALNVTDFDLKNSLFLQVFEFNLFESIIQNIINKKNNKINKLILLIIY